MNRETMDAYFKEKMNFYLKNNEIYKLDIHVLILLYHLLLEEDDNKIISELTKGKLDYLISCFTEKLEQSDFKNIYTKLEQTMYYKLISVVNTFD